MRTSRLFAGLVTTVLIVVALADAQAQQDDKGYLPPPSYRSKPAATNDRPSLAGRPQIQHKNGITISPRRRTRVARAGRRRYQRYAYYRPSFPFPGLFFGLF